MSGSGAEPHPTATLRPRLLSLPRLTFLAVAVSLVGAGEVPISDIAFAIASLLYTNLLSSFAFPASPYDDLSRVFNTPLLAVWVSAGAAVGLLLPLAYILHAATTGDQAAVGAASPHVFLLACQAVMEGLTFARGFSLPIRAFVPVFYSAWRMIAIADWLRAEIGREDRIVGRWLAVANLGFWGVNLFGFLLPVYLPRSLKRYYATDKAKKL